MGTTNTFCKISFLTQATFCLLAPLGGSGHNSHPSKIKIKQRSFLYSNMGAINTFVADLISRLDGCKNCPILPQLEKMRKKG